MQNEVGVLTLYSNQKMLYNEQENLITLCNVADGYLHHQRANMAS